MSKTEQVSRLCEQLDLDPILRDLYVREYKFHPHRRWRFDIAFPEHKIAVEYEGIMSAKSRHRTVTGYQKDCEKYNTAVLMGWRILRFTYRDVKQGAAFAMIKQLVLQEVEHGI